MYLAALDSFFGVFVSGVAKVLVPPPPLFKLKETYGNENYNIFFCVFVFF